MNKKLATLLVILIVLLPVGIVFADTFGDATPSGSNTDFLNEIRGCEATCPESGTADSIDVALVDIPASDCFVKCAIYKQSDKSLVGETQERNLNGLDDGLISFDFSDPKPSLSNIAYILCFWSNSSLVKFWYQSNASFTRHLQDLTYNGWPNPLDSTTSAYRYSVQCTYTPSAGEEENVFGTISPQFTVESQKTVSFNRYNTISQVFAVASQKSVAFTLLSSINQIFALSSYTNIAQNVINVLATISPLFSITSYRTWSYSVTSTVGLVWTLGSTVTATILRNVYGVIGQVFSITSYRTTSFLIDSTLNVITAIESTVILPGLVNIHATINALFGFLSHAAFTSPVEYATKGFVLVTIVLILLCFAVAVPIILRRRR